MGQTRSPPIRSLKNLDRHQDELMPATAKQATRRRVVRRARGRGGGRRRGVDVWLPNNSICSTNKRNFDKKIIARKQRKLIKKTCGPASCMVGMFVFDTLWVDCGQEGR